MQEFEIALLFCGFIGWVLLFAQLKLFSIDATLRRIAKKLEPLDPPSSADR